MKCLYTTMPKLFLAAVLIVAAFYTIAQSAGGHASHHPQQKTSPTPDSSAAMASNTKPKDAAGGMVGGTPGAKPDEKAGGMGAGMGDMMKEMGKAPTKEMYPSLMETSDLTAEKRNEINQLANKQITEGNALLDMGLKQLSGATRREDMEGMQDANEQMRRGQMMLESGLEGQRALAEDKDPRVTALQWYNREMNLPNAAAKQPHGLFGLSWFHYITMLTFVAFAAIMIWMYFHKMKRANALVEKLAGKTTEKIPPPGGAKPDAPAPGGAKPNAPPTPAKGEPAAKVAAVAAKPAPPKPAAGSTDMPPSKPNAWSGTLVASEIFEETPNVKTFRLTDPAGGKLPFNYLPGQFINLTVIPNGVPVKRSYTMASSPTSRDYCEITVKHEEQGVVSHYLHTKVHEGELLQITAPSGKFTFTEPDSDSIVLIAGGVGVTPFMSTIRYLTDRSWKKDIYLLLSCKNESGIIFHEEIGYLQKRYPNLHVLFMLSQPDKPNEAYGSGRITKKVITKFVPEITIRRIHICGPEPMMDAVKQMLNELEVPKENVKTELFTSPPDTPAPMGDDKPPDDAPKEPAGVKDDAAKPVETEEAAKPETTPESPAPPATPEENDKAPPADASDSAGTAAVATFALSNKTAVLTSDKSILEASEDIGVNIDYQCRVGICGVCKTKLNSGNVTMAVEDALTEDDKAENMILACQAKATEDVSVDA